MFLLFYRHIAGGVSIYSISTIFSLFCFVLFLFGWLPLGVRVLVWSGLRKRVARGTRELY